MARNERTKKGLSENPVPAIAPEMTQRLAATTPSLRRRWLNSMSMSSINKIITCSR